MDSFSKAESIIRDLKDELELRQGATGFDTVRQTKDADGWPMLILSKSANEAAGQPVIGIHLKGDSAVSTDIFGNAIAALAPHTMKFAYEDTEVTDADLLHIMVLAARKHFKVALCQVAAVTEANTVAATPSVIIDDLLFRGKLG